MTKAHGKTVDKIHKMVDGFLAERVKSDGGSWPEVSDKDFSALHELFQAVVDAKFERDCDGDSVINFYVVNRKRYMPLTHFYPVKYLHKVESLSDLLDIANTRQGEIRYASEQLSHTLRYIKQAHEEAAKRGMTPDKYLQVSRG